MKTILFKSLFVVALISLSHLSFGHNLLQPAQKDNAVTAPIYQLFDAMREHDENKILAQFTNQALLQRITNKGEVIDTDVKKFAASISKNTAKLDEHLLAVTINQQNELASVWTPFAFYLNDKIKKSAASDRVLKQTQLLGVLFFTIQLD